jgi:hypothetical protein
MPVYVVAYDKESEAGEEPADFYHTLMGLGAERIMSSVYVVASSGDAQSLHRYLGDFVSGEDRIFVTRLTEDFSGYVLREAAEWLGDHKLL